MKIKPLYDRIVVERTKSEEKTAGGIYIPDTAKEKPLEGVVRAVGDGRFNDAGDRVALTVAEGSRILFGKYSGTEINIDGTDLLILKEDEVLAIITD